MQKQLRLLAFLLFASLLMNSCGKDDDDTSPGKTKTELITQSSWKFQSANSSLAGDISTQPAIACYTDNVITFSSNNTGTVNEGANVCAPPAPSSFGWTFQNNESILRLDFTLFQGGSPDFTIVTLNETNLVVSQSVTIPPVPVAQTITVTFKH